MLYRIETKPAFALTGLGIRTTAGGERSQHEIPLLWKTCGEDGRLERLQACIPHGTSVGLAGVCCGFDAATEEFDYLIAVETPSDRSRLPEGCRDIPVAAATWGVFEVRGPMPGAMQDMWRRIFGEWFPASGWEHAVGPEIEVYPAGDPNAADYRSELWVPLRKATG